MKGMTLASARREQRRARVRAHLANPRRAWIGLAFALPLLPGIVSGTIWFLKGAYVGLDALLLVTGTFGLSGALYIASMFSARKPFRVAVALLGMSSIPAFGSVLRAFEQGLVFPTPYYYWFFVPTAVIVSLAGAANRHPRWRSFQGLPPLGL